MSDLDARLDALVAIGDATRQRESAEQYRRHVAVQLADALLAQLDGEGSALALEDELTFRVSQYRQAREGERQAAANVDAAQARAESRDGRR